MAIPAVIAGLVAQAGFDIASRWARAQVDQRSVAAAYAEAASEAIEYCAVTYPAGSPVWKEVVDLLGNADRAAEVIRQLQGQAFASEKAMVVSQPARDVVNQFASRFVQILAPEGGAAAQAIITAVGGLGDQIRELGKAVDPLAAIEWHRRPGAPHFRPSLGAHLNSRGRPVFGVTLSLLEGCDAPGDPRAFWSINGGPLCQVTLMPTNARQWQRQATEYCPLESSPAPSVARFFVKFVWGDGEHGWEWEWPVASSPKGGWDLRSHEGTGIAQPRPS